MTNIKVKCLTITDGAESLEIAINNWLNSIESAISIINISITSSQIPNDCCERTERIAIIIYKTNEGII